MNAAVTIFDGSAKLTPRFSASLAFINVIKGIGIGDRIGFAPPPRERRLALRTAPKTLWPLLIAGLLAATSPASAQPSGEPAASTAPAAKKAEKPKKARPRKTPSKTSKKPRKKPRRPPKAAAKTAATKPVVAKPVAAKPTDAAKAVPLPAARPALSGHMLAAPAQAALRPSIPAGPRAEVSPSAEPRSPPPPLATTITTSKLDIDAVKRAVELVRSRKTSEASDLEKSISDPVARKVVEWVILRSDDAGADFSRYAAFIAAGPNWPSIVTLRRKAEATIFQEQVSPTAIRAFYANSKPLSAKGRFALARALQVLGDSKGAEAIVREAWHHDPFSQDVENKVRDAFSDVLTKADDKARMDRRLYYPDDTDAGLRAATRLGGNDLLIAKARIAVLKKAGNAKALLDAVPAAARSDEGYLFSRIAFLRRSDQIAEAAQLLLKAPHPLDANQDTDEWWMERRLLVRKLLDLGEHKNAYAVARDATPPARDSYHADHEFTAGWIALRYLNDPTTALAHFSRIAEGLSNPISLGRAAYWQGRALDALKRPQEAHARYQEAARYPTAYYGQIARAKAGLGELTLNPVVLTPAQRNQFAQSELVRAAELLYAVDARDLVATMMADLGDKSDDAGVLVIMSELAAKYDDARGMLLVGKLALARGYGLEHAAFPINGLPRYTAIGSEVEPAIVYSIARQESWFNPKTISSANALGLMQVTPMAARDLARKHKVEFDQKRLLTDNVYNVQMGAAELGDVISDYRGSYIMAFAAYNAGRGRVREWIGKFGDPRDPKIDPIDWVERIPLSETRNYVQRVMENVQVYRVRFGSSSKRLIEGGYQARRRALGPVLVELISPSTR